MDPLATADQFQDWLGESIVDDSVLLARADSILTASSSLVRSEAGRTWDGEDVPDDVTAVVLQSAERKWRNPLGETQKTVGDVSTSYSGGGGAIGLYLTDDEKTVVRRYRTTASNGLWTLRTSRNDPGAAGELGLLDPRDDTWYAEVTPDGQPIPWLDGSQLA